jgi:CheY-like chemotaxis protein
MERTRLLSEVSAARDAALSASRAKDDFLAALSHELRTPLNPVLLIASEAAADATLPEAARRDFGTIAKNVMLEARLIDDLLDLTRIARGKITLDVQTVDAHTVLRDALEIVRADLPDKALHWELALTAAPSLVNADPARLGQVFWNVLKNAMKFTPHEGTIALRTAFDDATRELVVEISDTGIGLTPEELGRLFRSFSQGDHAGAGGSHRFGGLGLGLAISKLLIELHHGRIEARSAGRDCGATFRIALPLHTASVPSEASSTPSNGVSPPASRSTQATPQLRRILLVEDHAATRDAVRNLLTRRAYDVVCAASVNDALRLADTAKFDLVLSDIGLPDGDGYALMKALNLRYGLRGIALSGYGMEEDIARGQAAGFSAHLIKPVSVRNLEAALSAFQN